MGTRVKLRIALAIACAGATALLVGGAHATVTSGAMHSARSTSARSVARASTVSSKLPRPLGWIRNLQRDLSRLHFYSGPVTGVYTPATRAAVIRFQKAAHLVPDGEWGRKSQAALDKMLGRKPSNGKLPPPLGWIRSLQRDLTTLHFYSGPVTGVYTPATRAAVIRFQKAAHLVPDGLWGPKSQAALDKMLHRRK
jgi:peptidoglycan hydrolase-like protein with peptidoglycan-binding domain